MLKKNTYISHYLAILNNAHACIIYITIITPIPQNAFIATQAVSISCNIK